jgi:hypothetical protein
VKRDQQPPARLRHLQEGGVELVQQLRRLGEGDHAVRYRQYDRNCSTNVAERSARPRKSSNASRRMRYDLPIFKQDKRPSRHQR